MSTIMRLMLVGSPWRFLGMMLPPLTAVTVLGTLASRPAPIPPLEVEHTVRACSQPPKFFVAAAVADYAIHQKGDGWFFEADSILETAVCGPGTLTITASGQAANGQAPILQITLNGRVLAEERFTVRRTTHVVLPTAGRVRVTFANDLYQANVRLATLKGITFDGDCTTFAVDSPLNAWGTSASTNYIWLRRAPAILRPCGAGTLEMELYGQPAAQEYPIVQFKQGGKVVAMRVSRPVRTLLTLMISGEPLIITVVNPMEQVVANRSVQVDAIQFVLNGE